MASHSCKRAVGIPVLAENIAGLLTVLFCNSPSLKYVCIINCLDHVSYNYYL